jgi:hypothetical protein
VAGSYDKLTANIAAAGFIPKGFLAPRCPGVFFSTVLTLATTMRMVSGGHDYTADRWPDTHVTLAAGLADLDILMLLIAHGANRGHTVNVYHSNFSTR